MLYAGYKVSHSLHSIRHLLRMSVCVSHHRCVSKCTFVSPSALASAEVMMEVDYELSTVCRDALSSTEDKIGLARV